MSQVLFDLCDPALAQENNSVPFPLHEYLTNIYVDCYVIIAQCLVPEVFLQTYSFINRI